MKLIVTLSFCCALLANFTLSAEEPATKPPLRILFFTKSSGFEHPVISWKNGQPSHAEKVLNGIAAKKSWVFEFSKDGSKFSKEYLQQFNAVMFYTSGDLTKAGKDKNPPISKGGSRAFFSYIREGGGFVGLHSATDAMLKNGSEANLSHECPGDYVGLVGGRFMGHGPQQTATCKVINPKFPGYETLGASFTVHDEWYLLRNLNPDMHALTVLQTEGLIDGNNRSYKRPPYPISWARMEGKGRVCYNAMGHGEEMWDNPLYQNMVIGAIEWATGLKDVEIPGNLQQVAPGAQLTRNTPDPSKAEEPKTDKPEKAP